MVTNLGSKRSNFLKYKTLLLILIIFILGSFLSSCTTENRSENKELIKVGHGGGNIVSALYEAEKNDEFNNKYESKRLESNSTVAYALLSGNLDIGFVEAEKIKSMSKLEGFDKLKSVGKITYPYGATLILRKDLTNKITELNGLKIAVSSPNCKLLKAFSEDAERLNADISGIEYVTLEFDAMLPALEAKKVDAVIIKGFYSALALKEGHKVIYQNWDVVPGDECCPAIIDQAAFIMISNEKSYEEGKALAELLLKSQEAASEDELRKSIAENTTIPYEILKNQPVAKFSTDANQIIKVFLEADDHE